MHADWSHVLIGWPAHMRSLDRSEGTIRTRREHARWCARDHRDTSPWDLATHRLAAWLDDGPWAPATRRGIRNSLIGMYRWAVLTGITDHDPSAGLPPVAVPRKILPPAPDVAYRLALKIATPRVRLMVRLASECGLRRAEVACVHRRDIIEDLTGRSLVVHGKGSRDRLIPLPGSLAIDVISACHDGGGYAFPGQIDGHLSAAYVGKLVSRALPDAWAMHSLRRRAGTRWYEASQYDIRSVQELLGHTSLVTTQQYVTVPTARLRRIVGDAI